MCKNLHYVIDTKESNILYEYINFQRLFSERKLEGKNLMKLSLYGTVSQDILFLVLVIRKGHCWCGTGHFAPMMI